MAISSTGGTGSQAFRADFDLEEEDRFFISGVEKVGRSRNTYDAQLKKRKLWVALAITIGSIGLVALILGLAYGLSRRKLDYVCPRTYDPAAVDLVFYVVGDWGRGGSDGQRQAARLMSDVAGCMPPLFVVSTGDNFYPSGLSSADDPQFAASFSNVYTSKELQVPWHVIMGNHDYGDNVDTGLLTSGQCLATPSGPEQCDGKCCFSPWWQTHARLAARDARWNATMGGVVTRRFALKAADGGAARTLDLILVDTVPFIYQYAGRPWSGFLNGFDKQDGDALKLQLQQHLNASYSNGTGSTWRIVVGHHPVRSYGKHCSQPDSYDCQDMAFLRPWLQRYRVAAYVNGHDHDQQLIKAPDDPVHYVVSGAGSDTRKGEFDSLDPDVRSRDALFLSDTQGFLAVVLAGNVMRLHFYTTDQSGPTYTRIVQLPAW